MSDETDGSGPQSSEPKQKRLKPEEWAKIEMLWEYGLMRTVDISKQYGVTPSAITNHFAELAKKGIVIVKGSKKQEAIAAANQAKAAATAAKPVSEFEAKRKERIEGVKELMFKQGWMIGVHTAKIQSAVNDGTRTWVSAVPELKALKLAGQVLQLNRDNLYSVLDIANDIDERELPVLVFEDLTPAEIKQIQEGADDDVLDGLDVPDADEDNEVIEEGKPT